MKKSFLFVIGISGILAFGLVGFGTFSNAQTDPCLKNRAVYSIGSGTTRVRVAEVNTCTRQILRVFLNDARRVSYQADLQAQVRAAAQATAQGASNQPAPVAFSDAILGNGRAALSELQTVVLNSHVVVQESTLVATAAFRGASNAPQVLVSFANLLGVTSHRGIVVSQDEEMRAGFEGAVSEFANSIPRDQAVVWDIGGGSMQISTMAPSQGSGSEDHFISYQSTFASENFRQIVVTNILHQTFNPDSSTNGMTREQFKSAVRRARQESEDHVERSIVDKIIRFGGRNVIGIGGVLYDFLRCVTRPQMQSDRNGSPMCGPIGNSFLSSNALFEFVLRAQNWNDATWQNWNQTPYFRNYTSNLALVLGFYGGLGVTDLNFTDSGSENGFLLKSEWFAQSNQPSH